MNKHLVSAKMTRQTPEEQTPTATDTNGNEIEPPGYDDSSRPPPPTTLPPSYPGLTPSSQREFRALRERLCQTALFQQGALPSSRIARNNPEVSINIQPFIPEDTCETQCYLRNISYLSKRYDSLHKLHFKVHAATLIFLFCIIIYLFYVHSMALGINSSR